MCRAAWFFCLVLFIYINGFFFTAAHVINTGTCTESEVKYDRCVSDNNGDGFIMGLVWPIYWTANAYIDLDKRIEGIK